MDNGWTSTARGIQYSGVGSGADGEGTRHDDGKHRNHFVMTSFSVLPLIQMLARKCKMSVRCIFTVLFLLNGHGRLIAAQISEFVIINEIDVIRSCDGARPTQADNRQLAIVERSIHYSRPL